MYTQIVANFKAFQKINSILTKVSVDLSSLSRRVCPALSGYFMIHGILFDCVFKQSSLFIFLILGSASFLTKSLVSPQSAKQSWTATADKRGFLKRQNSPLESKRTGVVRLVSMTSCRAKIATTLRNWTLPSDELSAYPSFSGNDVAELVRYFLFYPWFTSSSIVLHCRIRFISFPHTWNPSRRSL